MQHEYVDGIKQVGAAWAISAALWYVFIKIVRSKPLDNNQPTG